MKRLLFLSVFLLAACQSTGTPTAVTEPTDAPSTSARSAEDPCGANKYQHIVGSPGGDIKDDMFPKGSRVLRPGMVMTMDYRSERLNVVIGNENTVERVYCG